MCNLIRDFALFGQIVIYFQCFLSWYLCKTSLYCAHRIIFFLHYTQGMFKQALRNVFVFFYFVYKVRIFYYRYHQVYFFTDSQGKQMYIISFLFFQSVDVNFLIKLFKIKSNYLAELDRGAKNQAMVYHGVSILPYKIF